MERLSSLMPANLKATVLSYDELVKARSDAYNEMKGKLDGYDCPVCHNKGMISDIRNGEEVFRNCTCMNIRASLKRIQISGLSSHIENCTLDKFECKEGWQTHIKNQAQQYINNGGATWFTMLGQSGSGKTHICTAVTAALMKQGRLAKYMQWSSESTELKSNVNEEEYQKHINVIKNIDVLYIDDLFKANVTKADVKLAFDIINYRGINNLTTIISSELMTYELIAIDEAIAGRIIQMSGSYIMSLKKNQSKNYRLK
ncbi:MAG: ATP-binding protein [Oscillospiraceae bacterium]|nr:ATP-binding protein [Oscillospiraceae bacterium]